MRCRYCDTPDSLERGDGFVVHSASGSTAYANPIEPRAVVAIVAHLIETEGPIDAISLTGGEPLTQPQFLFDFLRAAHFAVPVMLETAGVLPKPLATVLPHIDVVSMDIKLPTNTGEPAFWDEHAKFLELAVTKDLYVKILVDDATTNDGFERALELLERYPTIPVFLQPVMSASAEPTIGMARLGALQCLARRRLARVRVVPQVHKFLKIR